MTIVPDKHLSRAARISALRAVVRRGEQQIARLHAEAQDAPNIMAWQRIRAKQRRIATEVASARASIAQLEHAARMMPSRTYSNQVQR